jgi:hypothetical protein
MNGDDAALSSATSPKRSRRGLVYVALVAVLAVTYAANEVQVNALEGELQVVADERIASFRADEPPESADRLRIGSTVVVSKKYLIAGDVSGKISVFLEHADEGKHGEIEGFEFHLVRGPDKSWQQTDSGRCTSEQCTQEGLRVLRKLEGRR